MSSRTMPRFKFIILILYAFYVAKADRIHLLSSNVHFNRLYVQDLHADISSDHSTINVTYCLAQDQISDPYFDIVLDTKQGKSKVYRRVYRTKPLNVCDLPRKKNYLNDFIIHLLLLGGLDPSQCPLKKANFTWINLNLNNIPVPSFMSGPYRAELLTSFMRGKNLVSNLTVFFSVN